MSRFVDAYMQLWRSPKPVIAQVHGCCVGGGTDFALCSDLIVCAEDCRIGYPPARVWGSPTTAMWTYRLGPGALEAPAAHRRRARRPPRGRVGAGERGRAGRRARRRRARARPARRAAAAEPAHMMKLLVNQSSSRWASRRPSSSARCSTAPRATRPRAPLLAARARRRPRRGRASATRRSATTAQRPRTVSARALGACSPAARASGSAARRRRAMLEGRPLVAHAVAALRGSARRGRGRRQAVDPCCPTLARRSSTTARGLPPAPRDRRGAAARGGRAVLVLAVRPAAGAARRPAPLSGRRAGAAAWRARAGACSRCAPSTRRRRSPRSRPRRPTSADAHRPRLDPVRHRRADAAALVNVNTAPTDRSGGALSRRSRTSSARGWTKPGSLTRCLSSLRQTASRMTCSSSSSLAPGAQRRAQVGLAELEQAGAQLAVGGQADAVAVAAERLGDRVDEADAARAVGEAEDARRGAAARAARARAGRPRGSRARISSPVSTLSASQAWSASSGMNSMKRTS